MAQQIKITQTSNADMNIGVPKNMTAVEWLAERLIRMIPTISPMYKYEIKEFVEQAKAMEKEQIIKAAQIVLWNNVSHSRKEAEQYYNEEYGK
jgi:hypothetical protein